MCTPKLLTPPGNVLATLSTVLRYDFFTDWMPAHGISAADCGLGLRDVVGNWQGKPAYQTAAVAPEFPDSATVFSAGSYASTAGITHYRETLGLTNKAWIRFGVGYNLSSAGSLGTAQATPRFALNQSGSTAATGRVLINPGMVTTTDVNYFEIGGFAPTSGLDKVMAALVVVNNDSTYLENTLVCRTAMDPRQPNSWVAVEAAYDNPASGNSMRNTTALSAPAGANVSTNLLIQWGLAVRKKSGAAGNPRAEINVAVWRS